MLDSAHLLEVEEPAGPIPGDRHPRQADDRRARTVDRDRRGRRRGLDRLGLRRAGDERNRQRACPDRLPNPLHERKNSRSRSGLR